MLLLNLKNMKDEILKIFVKEGFLLDKEMLDFFSQLEDEEIAREVISKISILSKERVITKSLIVNNLPGLREVFLGLKNLKKKVVEKFFLNISLSIEVGKETSVVEEIDEEESMETQELPPKLKILSSKILPSKKIEVKDFVNHFRSRYNFLKNLLQERPELQNLVSIDKIGSNRNFSIIGIVSGKRVTKNKNLLLDVEDMTGKTVALVNHNREEVFEKSKGIVLDDIIGFKCSGTKEMLFVNDFIYPDCALPEKKKLDTEIYALFISDLHIGSGNFLEEKFAKFVDWLNGNVENQEQLEKIKKIKYLFIVGDSIDGVGVFPGQDKQLKILDITEQYEKLAFYLSKIPKEITIIMCPGQHDATRIAEPQPPPSEEFAAPLMKIENLFLVSNPSLVEIEGNGKRGMKVLMYHGASMHGLINEIEELRLAKAHTTPARVVKEFLKRRHLAVTHSSVDYIPSKEDGLLIREVPDIITTGEVHRADIDLYNNILIIANSCWQSQTPFEEKIGNIPDPCKVPMLNLKTRELKILDFS